MSDFKEQLAAVTAKRRAAYEFKKKCEAETERRAYEDVMLQVYNRQRATHPEMTDAQFRAFEIAQFQKKGIDHYNTAWCDHQWSLLPPEQKKRSMEYVDDDTSCGKFCGGPEDIIWIRRTRAYLDFLKHYDHSARCAYPLFY
jgi:hypothetical protein